MWGIVACAVTYFYLAQSIFSSDLKYNKLKLSKVSSIGIDGNCLETF